MAEGHTQGTQWVNPQQEIRQPGETIHGGNTEVENFQTGNYIHGGNNQGENYQGGNFPQVGIEGGNVQDGNGGPNLQLSSIPQCTWNMQGSTIRPQSCSSFCVNPYFWGNPSLVSPICGNPYLMNPYYWVNPQWVNFQCGNSQCWHPQCINQQNGNALRPSWAPQQGESSQESHLENPEEGNSQARNFQGEAQNVTEGNKKAQSGSWVSPSCLEPSYRWILHKADVVGRQLSNYLRHPNILDVLLYWGLALCVCLMAIYFCSHLMGGFHFEFRIK
ncbi:uncharacterized protein LOC110639012 [Hevea brasiliensis]|uniref:uncharacterized protein LOC110639012 n=1 Tax=Hevea brasiliensis TaxID=3981 RepID=UPI0025DF1BE7|nr:uncharacterized protein LOC110639012 [Hevea brasiliensis]